MEFRLLVLKDKKGVKSKPILQWRKWLNIEVHDEWAYTEWKNVPIVEEDKK